MLPEVRPLVERMVEHRRRLEHAVRRRERLAAAVGGNGGDLKPQSLGRARDAVEAEAAAVVRCIEAIQELGVQVKDPDRGLVDFPAVREGQDVLLCWQLGEDEVGHWHGREEGFAGRKPLPF